MSSMHLRRRFVGSRVAAALGLLLAIPAGAQERRRADDSLHRAIFREMVEMNTSPVGGNVSRLSRAVARRLVAAGYPARDVEVIGPNERCLNVVARLRGRESTAKPILLMAHLDVVPAKREDWKFDPYVLREDGGWFYGRGAMDNKAGASVIVANLVRWKRERFVPSRDVITVLTCDEETTAQNGIIWLLANHPKLKEAEYALNSDAGEVSPRAGNRAMFEVQAAEKVYASFELTARNPGGHSSVPRADNAIYALASALGKLAAHRFPVQFNDVTRTGFARAAAFETGSKADDFRAAGRGETSGPHIDRLIQSPYHNSNLRTTCVATMLAGGHAENALPQSATATVNCRIFPGVDAAEVQRTLAQLVADTSITVKLVFPATPSPPSALRPDLFGALEKLSTEFWPGSAVVPGMSNGATDGLYVRNAGVPVYGVAAIFMNPDDDRSHGLDEKVPVESLYRAREFWNRLVRDLTTASTRTM